MNMKVADYLLQTLEKNGVSQIFGNPGTTELPLVKACEQRPHLRYVVALSEVSAVPMADGLCHIREGHEGIERNRDRLVQNALGRRWRRCRGRGRSGRGRYIAL